MCVFPTRATCLCHAGGGCSLFSYPLPFSSIVFVYDSRPSFPCLIFFVFLSIHHHSSIFAVVSMGILCVFFSWPAGESGVPSSLIRLSFLVLSFYDVHFLSFSSMSFLPNDLRISAVVFMGILCFFSTIATCLCPVGEPVPFSRILFPFLVLLSYDVPFLSFLLCLFCPLIYICCSFHGHSMCVFSHYSHVFVACRAIWSSLFSYPLLFAFLCLSFSFLFFPFLSFSSMSFLPIELYLL